MAGNGLRIQSDVRKRDICYTKHPLLISLFGAIMDAWFILPYVICFRDSETDFTFRCESEGSTALRHFTASDRKIQLLQSTYACEGEYVCLYVHAYVRAC